MRLRSCLAAILLLAAIPAAPRVAYADEQGREQARRLFEEGLDLEKKSDYAGALAKYREAEKLAVTAGLRFHKGYCLEMTGSLAAALEEYEGADKLAREQNKQDVRSATAVRLDPLRARVPQLSLRVAPAGTGAEVRLDGAAVAAPLHDGKPFRVDPGDHKLTARASGFRPYARNLHVPETALTTIEIALERDAPPAAVPAAVAPPPAGPATADAGANAMSAPVDGPPSEAPRSRSLVLPIATTAGAVGLAVAGVAFFAVAGGIASDADVECPRRVTCEDEQSRVRTFDTLALGSFIGAAALGTVAIVLWASPGPRAASRPSTSTRFVASPSAVGLAGSF